MKEICWVLTELEAGVYSTGDVTVRSGDTVVDCGANIGLFAREALRAGAKVVVAVEPSPANVECLKRNLRAEIAAGRVVLKESGLWDSTTSLPFTISDRSSLANSFVIEPGAAPNGTLTPVTTLDQIVEDLGLVRVDFIKMDIEGAEQRALQGGSKTLTQYRPKMAIGVEHEFPTILDNARAVRDLVLKINPEYKSRCGLCIEGSDRAIAPQVLWFQ